MDCSSKRNRGRHSCEGAPFSQQHSRTCLPGFGEHDDEAIPHIPHVKGQRWGRTRLPRSFQDRAQASPLDQAHAWDAFFPKPGSLGWEYYETKIALEQAKQLYAREYPPWFFPGGLRYPRRAWDRPVVVFTVLLSSLVIIVAFLIGQGGVTLSRWLGPFSHSLQRVVPFIVAPPPNPPGDYRFRGPPSLDAERINEILSSYGSPAAGTGDAWVRLGRRHGIDPAFALAFFIHESAAGTHMSWAGRKPDGTTTHNIGNIICAGYPRCYGRFRDYRSWEEGIEDWYRLIDLEYIRGRGLQTVDEVIPIYAPAVENDVEHYVSVVKRLVDSWRTVQMQGRGLPEMRPNGCPLRGQGVVVTQGYGVGSHVPAPIWGAIDLAIDGDGDGTADPQATWAQPVYATHNGIARVQSNTWPAGNHIWIINSEYKTSYSHLKAFAVIGGQMVQRGDLIGFIGSTGQSSGPHLDYQVWRSIRGSWVNQDPLQFGACL